MCSAAVVVLLGSLAGCGGDGDDNDEDDGENRPAAVAGTYVGKLSGSEAFVAVVAAPPQKGKDRRDVTAFVCDGRDVCAWLAGSATGNDFTVKSDDGEAQGKGTLSGKTVKGSVELPDAEPARYEATEATATAGLYDLTVSSKGRIEGASAAGVGLTGKVAVPPPGRGRIKLADGTRLRFRATAGSAAKAARLKPGLVRMIVLSDGQVRGAGRTRGDHADFLVRSAAAT